MKYADKKLLLDTGYIPVPIVQTGKNPAVKGWTAADYNAPSDPKHNNCGIGILCGRGKYPVVGVDCDVMDGALAGKLQELILQRLGETVYRIGQAPKAMYVYRVERAGIRKMTSPEYDCGRVELCSYGQQFVAFGTHPGTKKPYTWPGILGSIADVPASVLPIVREDQLRGLLRECGDLMAAAGYKLKTVAPEALGTDYDPEDPLDRAAPVNLKLDACRKMLDDIDPDCGRDQWRNIGMAMHHESKGSPEWAALYEEWSERGTKYKPGEPLRIWESFGRYTGRPITGAYLLKLQKEIVRDGRGYFEKLNWSPSRFVDNPPSQAMVIEKFLPAGVTSIFYSAGGAGKSTLVLYMAVKIAAAVTYETDFLGKGVSGGKVVILTAEDPDQVINRRYIGILRAVADSLGIELSAVREVVEAHLSIVSTFADSVQLFRVKNDVLEPTDFYDSFLSCLQDMKNLKLVIIDTKTRYSPAEGLGNVTATQEITYYEKICRTTGASVMLLHHSNKASRNGSQTGAQAYRDSSALFDSVRAAWYLTGMSKKELSEAGLPESDEGKYLLLENSKNNYIEKHKDMILYRDSYQYDVRGTVTKTSPAEKKETRRQQVYDYIIGYMQAVDGTALSQADIIKMCKPERVGRPTVIETLDALVEDCLVARDESKTGNGYAYRLTLEGRNYGKELA